MLETNQTFWKWVFFICCILYILPHLSAFSRIDLNFGIVLSAITLVALYGLAFKKAIGSPGFWRVFFWVYVTIGVFAALFIALAIGKITNHFDGGLITGPLVLVGNIVILTLILLFFGVQVIGLYLYAFRRGDVWTRNGEGGEQGGDTTQE